MEQTFKYGPIGDFFKSPARSRVPLLHRLCIDGDGSRMDPRFRSGRKNANLLLRVDYCDLPWRNISRLPAVSETPGKENDSLLASLNRAAVWRRLLARDLQRSTY